MTRDRMRALRYPAEDIETVSRLVELHLRFHTYQMGWTDSAVRRYVRDAGPLLDRLNELTRCDCTTRNAARARALARRMDELEARIAELRQQEELAAIRPDLDGNEVMARLGIAAGPGGGPGPDVPARAAPRGGPARRRGGRPAAPARRLVGRAGAAGRLSPGSDDPAAPALGGQQPAELHARGSGRRRPARRCPRAPSASATPVRLASSGSTSPMPAHSSSTSSTGQWTTSPSSRARRRRRTRRRWCCPACGRARPWRRAPGTIVPSRSQVTSRSSMGASFLAAPPAGRAADEVLPVVASGSGRWRSGTPPCPDGVAQPDVVEVEVGEHRRR